jgi:hypothetical protein
LPENREFYNVYNYGDTLDVGHEMKIEHEISLRGGEDRLKKLISLPRDEIEKLRGKSADAEQAVFDRLCEDATEWEAIAAETALMDRALTYLKIPAAVHTSNEWVDDTYGHKSISNTVYQMSYHIYEDKSYDRETKEHITKAWYLTWNVRIGLMSSEGRHYGNIGAPHTLAGQRNKRFTDKAVMDKYLAGRIKAYGHLFTDENPPIPLEYANCFKFHNMLLPGYRAESETVRAETISGRAAEKPSVLKALADKSGKETEPGNASRRPPSPER